MNEQNPPHPSTPAGKEERPMRIAIKELKDRRSLHPKPDNPYSEGKYVAYNDAINILEAILVKHPSPQSEQAGEKEIIDDIIKFVTASLLREPRELTPDIIYYQGSINAIREMLLTIRKLPSALWQAASHEKGVRDFEKIRELACDFCWENKRDIDNGYQEVHKAFDNWLNSNPYHQKWLSESPAPDTVQGQEELWEFVKWVSQSEWTYSSDTDKWYGSRESGNITPITTEELKSIYDEKKKD